MKVSQRLLETALPIWERYYRHPFVQGIASGTLPREKFQFYMIQDHKYLMQYAKVFALGVIRADRESDMRLFATLINGTLNTENAVHKWYLGRLGISQEGIDRAPMCLNNESYTNYMISVAFKEGLAELATVVLACAWSYKLIGDYVESIPGSLREDNFYRHWIKTYTSPAYREDTKVMIDFVDRLTEGYSEEQLKNLDRIITNCSEYEYQFWDMAWTRGGQDQ
ncbi:thiaminase II [uncultured Oscillibacter sp.]|uniref:thiaminase II n=1 Tax=uncultured Oscillibacter sp. TaxID=876091 RepID=UPI0025E40CD4|nr:thiaminase II [uncultured Oscillibacter sp.]